MRYLLLIVVILLPTLSFSEIIEYRNRDGSLRSTYDNETGMVRDRSGSAEGQWNRDRSEYRDRSGSYEYGRSGGSRSAPLAPLAD